MSCKHTTIADCYMDINKIVCSENCLLLLSCGHSCQEKCQATCTKQCNVLVKKQLLCGHLKIVECSKTTIECDEMVEKQWPVCNHTVLTKCSTVVDETECPKKCDQKLADCEHKCQGTCGKCQNGKCLKVYRNLILGFFFNYLT